MKLGIAIAANRPIMATTIMISTSVKPLLRAVRIFILDLSFVNGVNTATSGLLLFQLVFTYCLLLTVSANLTAAWLKRSEERSVGNEIRTRRSVRYLTDEGLTET